MSQALVPRDGADVKAAMESLVLDFYSCLAGR